MIKHFVLFLAVLTLTGGCVRQIHEWRCPHGCVNYIGVDAEPGILERNFDTSKADLSAKDASGELRTFWTVDGKPLVINLDNEVYSILLRANKFFEKIGEPIWLSIYQVAPKRDTYLKIRYK